MKKYSESELRARFKQLGYDFPDFHIIGVRSNADEPDKFDDNIYLFDNGTLLCFTGTTNPGAHWLQNFLNKMGTAVLKPGQYINSWAIGKHQGVYEALVQIRPVTVYRDSDKDLKAEEQGTEDVGMFGINIHRANPSVTSVLIGKWSAGCQVLNNPSDFATLMDRCRRSSKSQFTYTLLKEF